MGEREGDPKKVTLVQSQILTRFDPNTNGGDSDPPIRLGSRFC